jgi:hypothetical protein
MRGRNRAEISGRCYTATPKGAFVDIGGDAATRIAKAPGRAASSGIEAALQIVKRISQALDVERFFRYEPQQVPLHLSLQFSRVFDTLDGNCSSLDSELRGNRTAAVILSVVSISGVSLARKESRTCLVS